MELRIGSVPAFHRHTSACVVFISKAGLATGPVHWTCSPDPLPGPATRDESSFVLGRDHLTRISISICKSSCECSSNQDCPALRRLICSRRLRRPRSFLTLGELFNCHGPCSRPARCALVYVLSSIFHNNPSKSLVHNPLPLGHRGTPALLVLPLPAHVRFVPFAFLSIHSSYYLIIVVVNAACFLCQRSLLPSVVIGNLSLPEVLVS